MTLKLCIELQKIEVHVQAVAAIVDFADHQLKAATGRQVKRDSSVLAPFSSAWHCSCGKRAQIVARDTIRRGCRQNALLSICIHHHPQHIVAGNELVPCFLQYGEIELIVAFIPFKQHVTGNAAIANKMGSAQPVGMLNRRQREGRVTLSGIVLQRFRRRYGRRRLCLRTDKL